MTPRPHRGAAEAFLRFRRWLVRRRGRSFAVGYHSCRSNRGRAERGIWTVRAWCRFRREDGLVTEIRRLRLATGGAVLLLLGAWPPQPAGHSRLPDRRLMVVRFYRR